MSKKTKEKKQWTENGMVWFVLNEIRISVWSIWKQSIFGNDKENIWKKRSKIK